MTQIWINQLQSKDFILQFIYSLDIDANTTQYMDKTHVYTAKAILSNGFVYDFGVGSYNGVFQKQNTVTWDKAMYHVSSSFFKPDNVVFSLATYQTWSVT